MPEKYNPSSRTSVYTFIMELSPPPRAFPFHFRLQETEGRSSILKIGTLSCSTSAESAPSISTRLDGVTYACCLTLHHYIFCTYTCISFIVSAALIRISRWFSDSAIVPTSNVKHQLILCPASVYTCIPPSLI